MAFKELQYAYGAKGGYMKSQEGQEEQLIRASQIVNPQTETLPTLDCGTGLSPQFENKRMNPEINNSGLFTRIFIS